MISSEQRYPELIEEHICNPLRNDRRILNSEWRIYQSDNAYIDENLKVTRSPEHQMKTLP
jgi:hypothetical protein